MMQLIDMAIKAMTTNTPERELSVATLWAELQDAARWGGADLQEQAPPGASGGQLVGYVLD